MCDKVKVLEVEPATKEILNDCFKGRVFARFGDPGYLLNACYKEDADNIRNMPVRPDDVWVTTFPRSDLLDASLRQEVAESTRSYEEIVKSPSPRFFKAHLPFSLLPSTLLDSCKVVFVARDPRDIAVSYYHYLKLITCSPGDFKSFWNLFISDLVPRGPFLKHLKEAWALRHHQNMLFIFYEDMNKDLSSSIKRISNFLGKKVKDEQIEQLCKHLDIENFRKNTSVNPTWWTKLGSPDAEGFVRVGKSGGWREHFDEEMAAQAQRWLHEGLAGSGLRFPHNSSLVFD